MQASRGWFRHLSSSQQNAIAERYIKLLNIATPSAEQPVRNLSGGNQQKVILARWLATEPRLLILDEPTRGIDVGTKADIQKLVLSLAEGGMSCMFISSELDEVLRTCHRIVVLRDRVEGGRVRRRGRRAGDHGSDRRGRGMSAARRRRRSPGRGWPRQRQPSSCRSSRSA